MRIYLVGGAVRDQLLSLPVEERDWVVVGATPEEMITQGFRPVGKEFPVFLHPTTNEEYALARTERKVAKGYRGFKFYTSPTVTLEQDLLRRDLTINAMAMDEENHLIDPYHGYNDLQQKILRHVSNAFTEDPVRILRIARFNARFADFNIYPETLSLMRTMVKNGEINALVPERVWAELFRALQCEHFEIFFLVLNSCGALEILFPEIKPIELKRLKEIHKAQLTPLVRFAVLLHHIDHHNIKKLSIRFRVPNEFVELALMLNKYDDMYHCLNLTRAKDVLQFLQIVDALRKIKRFHNFLIAARLCSRGDEKRNSVLIKCLEIIKNIDTTKIQHSGAKGLAFANKLKQLRLECLEKYLLKI